MKPKASGFVGSRVRAFWAWAGICALTLLAYRPALGSGFVWDDDEHVTKMAMRSLHGLWRIWFELGSTQQYYPVLFSAFWLEHRFWGDAALGYHLTNILLHATSAWLFGLILRRLAIPGAWLGALIFALHPVCVESVAWVSEQKNTLSTVFYLLAVLAYLRFDARPSAFAEHELRRGDPASLSRWRDRRSTGTLWYVLATALFVLAMLSKTVTATLPAALLVVCWWKRGRLSWKGDILPLVPWLGLGAALGIFSAWVERKFIGAQGADFTLNGVQRCLVAGRAIWFYLTKLLWPGNLIFIYPRWQINASQGWQYLFPLGAVAVIGALWLIRRRSRAPLAALLFFVGSLFPTLGFFNVFAFIYSYVTDHWQYLASLGIIALVAAAWGTWVRRTEISGTGRTRSSLGLLAPVIGVPQFSALALLCCLGVLTWRQSRAYHDEETFYRVILDRNPDSWMAHNNLGNALSDTGHLPEAIAQYEEAVRLKPDYPEAHSNLGSALAKMPGRLNDAVAQLEEAVRQNRDYAEVHFNLANALRAIPGRLPEALAQYEAALRIKPDYADAHANFANALAEIPGRMPEALAHYDQALRIKPDFAEAHYNLANKLANIPGREPDALAHYEAALRIRPNFADAQNNLAVLYARMGRFDEAIAHWELALKLDPAVIGARDNLNKLEAMRR